MYPTNWKKYTISDGRRPRFDLNRSIGDRQSLNRSIFQLGISKKDATNESGFTGLNVNTYLFLLYFYKHHQ
jgi:hypothetical protein